MAPVFASADIAALVAAFPPPSPTTNQPSLLKSRSGNSLRHSSQAQANFRQLLESSPTRIQLRDLPARLDVDNTDWLLASDSDLLRYSRCGHSLVPSPEASRIVDDVLKRSKDAPVSLTAISHDQGISTRSLHSLFQEQCRHETLHMWHDSFAAGDCYVYSQAYMDQIREWMRSLTDGDWAEGIDMNQHYPDLPAELLLELAKGAASGIDIPDGRWELLNDRAVFIPATFEADLEGKKRAARDAQVNDLVESLISKGYCCISTPADTDSPSNDLVDDVKTLYSQRAPQVREASEKLQESSAANYSAMVLVQPSALDRACETLRIAAPQEAARIWHAREGSESSARLKTAVFESLGREVDDELARLVLPIAHRMQLEDIVIMSLNKLEHEDLQRHQQAVTERLLAPIQLYAAGIETIKDDTLKQHLEEYLGGHFRREVVPTTIDWLREERLLLERSRRKDVDKMQQACNEAKTLSDVQAAVSRLARKHKIALPPPDHLQQAKCAAWQGSINRIRKLSRGSDLLQNLIWVKLGESTGGLFVSPGKDTTRMIKQYLAVGDAEVGRQLEQWRDDLKAGKEDKAMLEEMRGMALAALEEMAGSQVPAPSP